MEENIPDSHICQQNAERQDWKGDGKVQNCRVRLQINQNCYCTLNNIQGVNDAKSLVHKYLNK